MSGWLISEVEGRTPVAQGTAQLWLSIGWAAMDKLKTVNLKFVLTDLCYFITIFLKILNA